MKSSRNFIYPLGAVLIVAAFWVCMVIVQTPRRSQASEAGHASAQGTGTKSQGFSSAMRTLAAGEGTPQKAATQDSRNWWGARLHARTLEVDEDEPAIPAGEVIELMPGSPAVSAGLRKGDLIVGAQGEQISSVSGLEQTVAAVPAGGNLSLQILRAGEPLELMVPRGGQGAAGSSPQHALPATASGAPGVSSPQSRTGISINGRELSAQQVQQLRMTYGYVAPPGQYWYDSRSGLYGVMGREAAGFMQPGHDFGPLPADASNGNTGVFINGRQINMVEAMYCQHLFGAVYQGRWWLDGRTGNLGMEGSPMPVANVFMALQQAQRSSQGGSYSWHSRITGAYGGSDGKCSYVSIPGSGSVMTGNCD